MKNEQLIEMKRAERAEAMRDFEAVRAGKLRAEDLSIFHSSPGWKLGEIDFSKVTLAVEADDEDSGWAED